MWVTDARCKTDAHVCGQGLKCVFSFFKELPMLRLAAWG